MTQDAPGAGGTPLDPSALDPGTNVLVAGPAMTGKRRLLFDLVGGSPDRAGVLITTKRDANRFREGFAATRTDADAWDLRMVDCVSRRRGVQTVRDTDTTHHVTSAGDLTGIGISTSGFLREFYHADRAARLGLHSLSTLLMFADLRRVYQFTHVITGRIESSGFCGAFTLDTTSRGSESLNVLTQVFDALVEVRDEDGGPELRVRGRDFGPRQWTGF